MILSLLQIISALTSASVGWQGKGSLNTNWESISTNWEGLTEYRWRVYPWRVIWQENTSPNWESITTQSWN